MWCPDLAQNSAYLDSKYCENPYSVGEPIIYLALCEGRVVGMRSAAGTCWERGQPSGVMRGLSSTDAVVHPDHRCHGLLQAMTTMMLSNLSDGTEYEYDFTFSVNQFLTAQLLKSGWRSAGSLGWVTVQPSPGDTPRWRGLAHTLPVLPSMYRWLHSHVRRGIASSSPALALLFGSLDLTATDASPAGVSHIRVEKAPRPSDMAALVEGVGADGRMRHVRDEGFYAWRFRNSLSKYRFLFWEKDDLEGYLVLQAPASPKGNDWVTIVDWEAKSPQVWAELFRVAMRLVRSSVLTIWSATIHEETKALLDENGFSQYEWREAQTGATFQHSLFVPRLVRAQPEADWVLGG